MIQLVSGPPGAGKTYYTCRKIAEAILAGKMVATNVVLVEDWAERIASTVPTLRLRRRARPSL